MRAFAELWDEICRDRYGVTEEKYRRFRYGVQVNSLGLTEQQPENNVYRILLEMLAVVLSKNARARAVQLPAWNEALGLPRPWDQQWSLRLQQILAYETDLLEYGDIFDGAPVIAAKVDEIASGAARRARGHRRLGGAVAAIESGYMKRALVESNARRLSAIERGEQIVVGVNGYTESAPSPLLAGGRGRLPGRSTPRSRRRRSSASSAWRAARDAAPVAAALAALAAAAREGAQHHGAVDRLRQGRRHHRRVGRRRCARSSASIARRPASRGRRAAPRGRRHVDRGGARARRRGLAARRPAPQDAGRQARPRRPLQRRRADRARGARRRLRGRLRGHPPDPGRRSSTPRSRRASTSSACRSSPAATWRWSPR